MELPGAGGSRMSSLFDELSGFNSIRQDPRAVIHGRRRVRFASEEELRHEQRLIDEAAKESAQGRPTSKHLLLAAMKDGRARYEMELAELAGLSHDTVMNTLRQLRRAGMVERVEVGPAVLWSVTWVEEE